MRVPGVDPRWGITAVRVAMGAILVLAGVDKLVEGVGVTVSRFAQWAIPAPGLAGPFVAVIETIGGAFLILGFLTRWFGLAFAIQFAFAAVWVKYRLYGWDVGRVDLMLAASGLLLWLNGPGRAAFDRD